MRYCPYCHEEAGAIAVSDDDWLDSCSEHGIIEGSALSEEEMMLEQAMEEMNIEDFVLHVDENWRDNFKTIDEAFLRYWTYMEPTAKRAAVKAVLGE